MQCLFWSMSRHCWKAQRSSPLQHRSTGSSRGTQLKKREFGHCATAWMPSLTLPAAALTPELSFVWEGGAHPMGNRLTLQSDDRQAHAEPGLPKEGKILQSPQPCQLPAVQLIPTHRHVRPAPCIPRFGNGVHKLPTNAEVTEFNVSISVQKNIGRFDVCKAKKFKSVSHSWRFQFQEQQLQRINTGSAAQLPLPLGGR